MLRELRHESAIHIVVFISSTRSRSYLFGLLLASLAWRLSNLLLQVFDLVLELLILLRIIKPYHHLVHLAFLVLDVICKDKSLLKLALLLLVDALIYVCFSDCHLILQYSLEFFL